ncbi:WXG100 family type VII secretion target [Dactylosporangium sp. NPDC048998]|uniref:WXG100 family type VII secretion target n=1 Tax=Dactylosporangium sp. NPDC048998 TaxID=3363976 RepID=UPI00371794E9
MTNPLANTVDDATITATLHAFETTMAQVNAAIQSVDAVSGSVQWTGVAATTYRNSLAEWIGGVQQVRSGLEQLQTAMTQHLNISTNTEDEAATNAKWFA